VREVKVTALVVVSADRGFAGTYNVNVLRAAEHRVRTAPPGSIRIVVLGRKGRDYFKRRYIPVLAAYTDLPAEADLEMARRLTADLTARFLSGEVDRVEVLYTHFVNALVRRLQTEVFLPVSGPEGAASADAGTIFEPDPAAIFAELLPRYATAKFYAATADAFASEYSARMVAMGSARKNAGELIDSLTLISNRMRQASITKELSEIVAGADAQK
jgi:F-type H+-transporting ATPase subunit gamma